jgi:hypothetical protein
LPECCAGWPASPLLQTGGVADGKSHPHEQKQIVFTILDAGGILMSHSADGIWKKDKAFYKNTTDQRQGDRFMKKDDLLALSRESLRQAYRSKIESWCSLDAKAQGATAIAGLLLAASVGWSKLDNTVEDHVVGGWVYLLLVTSLAFSVICAVIALMTRRSPSSPEGGFIDDLVVPLAKGMTPSVDLSDDQAMTMHKAIADKWKDAIMLAGKATRFKATWIRRSHSLLVVAASLAVSILSSQIVHQPASRTLHDDVRITRVQKGNETWKTVVVHMHEGGRADSSERQVDEGLAVPRGVIPTADSCEVPADKAKPVQRY